MAAVPAFDRLTAMAVDLTGVAVAVVTLADEHRARLLSARGMPPTFSPDEVPVGDSFCQFVVARGAEWIVDDVEAEPLLRDLPTTKELEAASWAGFPVRGPDGEVVGSLCLVDRANRRWTPEHITLLRHIAEAASSEIALRLALWEAAEARGLAEAHARESDAHASAARRETRRAQQRAEEAADLARTLQESLLPTSMPRTPGLDLGSRYRAGAGGSEVLGDFYDVFPIPSGWGLVLGDVCGKGVTAARTTALARSTVRALGHAEEDPQAVLGALNEVLVEWFGDRRSFVTAVYATLRPRGDGFVATVASAGHPAGFVLGRAGMVTALQDGGRVLGLLPEAKVAVESVDLAPGDSLVLFTDGVTESRRQSDRVQFDEDGVATALRSLAADSSADSVAEAVSAAALRHAEGLVQDDTAVLVARALAGTCAGDRPLEVAQHS
ncbi:GAF domain-containing SpoIIE family protein phosphatase [Actinomycetospora sp. NBRC 106378]|uniref:PP2C family protein-serine/threonine phosphatase n=1 Tax=Actinomycetospora sp. NBRC 106378 TaxID=3032208 RepID=UPI0024A20D78|nr:GAF domain-containing SpoIIE family protein phosphatase [Actinomycetospora sp. NBRC 106378]GLZ53434.1 hypothetical protein Acsp07_30510 [Actinomycetospora sp. NBRC 106378]